MYVMYLYALINVPFRRYKYWFQKQTEAIFNLNKSKMIIMILLAIYYAVKFSEL